MPRRVRSTSFAGDVARVRALEGIVIVGRDPGRTEVAQGKPFVGDSGILLNQELGFNGIDKIIRLRNERCSLSHRGEQEAFSRSRSGVSRSVDSRDQAEEAKEGPRARGTAAESVTGEKKTIADLRAFEFPILGRRCVGAGDIPSGVDTPEPEPIPEPQGEPQPQEPQDTVPATPPSSPRGHPRAQHHLSHSCRGKAMPGAGAAGGSPARWRRTVRSVRNRPHPRRPGRTTRFLSTLPLNTTPAVPFAPCRPTNARRRSWTDATATRGIPPSRGATAAGARCVSRARHRCVDRRMEPSVWPRSSGRTPPTPSRRRFTAPIG